ncbi:hypothetical protein GCM10011613_30520 [Cellvibrio zantedeschiae]|uniref:N-acetyltransferase domain-containing protein n=1 Tax=Cellvibrio zantedeschiae TaxID=1237077 RepID=A0ABQ3B8P6_9GAMM|nr:GNAT family N-acetyltransferase [Cellvibrio zantedeschiae]GGY83519.1 hypothetical protein GCM10011613_30520 [Cellvibrio zantedeschiae]
MTISLLIAQTDKEIEGSFSVFKELRPHLEPELFLPQIRRQQAQGYQLLLLRENDSVKSVAGFRMGEFLAWGKIVYIDDLATLSSARSKGYADMLMDWVINYAREQGCKAVHLDTGYARHDAHRLYLRKKMKLTSHHMSLEL